MHDCEDAELLSRWFPVAGAGELAKGHVFQAQLLGEELVVWRADDGQVNAWQNRCPHRGVRLSIGSNLGSELRCQYHGMRFASGTGQCSFVPAHPKQPPPRTLHVKTYRAVERYGFVWVAIQPVSDVPAVAVLEDVETTVLRSLPVNASAPLVAEALTDYRFRPSAVLAEPDRPDAACSVEVIDAFTLGATATVGPHETTAVLFVQPVDRRRAVIHGCLPGPLSTALRPPVLRHHNERLSSLRKAVESTGRTALDLTVAAPAASPHGMVVRSDR
jgi:nitrite reductase/ring-hydroxylating ferredoxin subunit